MGDFQSRKTQVSFLRGIRKQNPLIADELSLYDISNFRVGIANGLIQRDSLKLRNLTETANFYNLPTNYFIKRLISDNTKKGFVIVELDNEDVPQTATLIDIEEQTINTANIGELNLISESSDTVYEYFENATEESLDFYYLNNTFYALNKNVTVRRSADLVEGIDNYNSVLIIQVLDQNADNVILTVNNLEIELSDDGSSTPSSFENIRDNLITTNLGAVNFFFSSASFVGSNGETLASGTSSIIVAYGNQEITDAEINFENSSKFRLSYYNRTNAGELPIYALNGYKTRLYSVDGLTYTVQEFSGETRNWSNSIENNIQFRINNTTMPVIINWGEVIKSVLFIVPNEQSQGIEPQSLSFIDNNITQLITYFNRLVIISSSGITFSRVNDFLDFFSEDPINLTADDPFNILFEEELISVQAVSLFLFLFFGSSKRVLYNNQGLVTPLSHRIDTVNRGTWYDAITPVIYKNTIFFLTQAGSYFRLKQGFISISGGGLVSYEENDYTSDNITLIDDTPLQLLVDTDNENVQILFENHILNLNLDIEQNHNFVKFDFTAITTNTFIEVFNGDTILVNTLDSIFYIYYFNYNTVATTLLDLESDLGTDYDNTEEFITATVPFGYEFKESLAIYQNPVYYKFNRIISGRLAEFRRVN